MKALILHGTDNDHKGNWFPWLKSELEKLGFEVWVPDLPGAECPDLERYTEFLLGKGWDFDGSLIVGHSSGAVEVLDLLQNLPAAAKVKTAIMVAVFKGSLGWESLRNLKDFKPDFESIKRKADKFIVVHSDDDPHCPVEDAADIADKLGADMEKFHGMKHFSINTDPRFTEFPELLEIIKRETLKNT